MTDLADLLYNYENIWSDTMTSYPGRPLRLVDINSIVKTRQLVFVPAEPDLKYCILSYTWATEHRNRKSPYLLEQISSFTVEGLVSAVYACYMLKHQYFWIDALCIDQRRSSNEKQREIPNMGKYYQDATECIIFPQGLHLNAEILPEGKLPRWFYRSWTLQEWVLPKKKTFVFGSNTEHVLGYMTVGGPVLGNILNTIFGKCVCISSHCLTWLLRLTTDQWTGSTPLKAEQPIWKEINRESAFMCETNPSRKGDILQRAMFRESKYEEDKIYSLLSTFSNVIIDIKYEIGLDEATRNLAEAVTSNQLASMLLTNWHPTTYSDTSADISALPTFERQTAAVWFNMGEIDAVCKYIRSEGVHISTRIIKCKMRVGKLYDDSIVDSINDNSDLPIQDIELITPCITLKAYGRSFYEQSDITLVIIGKFQRIQSALTGARADRRDLQCCLLCYEKENTKLQKIGMCICDFSEIYELDEASLDILIHQANVILG